MEAEKEPLEAPVQSPSDQPPARAMRRSFARRALHMLDLRWVGSRAGTVSLGDADEKTAFDQANGGHSEFDAALVEAENIDRRRDVRSLPHYQGEQPDQQTSAEPQAPPNAQTAHHNHLPEDPKSRFNPQAGRGKGWHHARSVEAVTLGFPQADHLSRWAPFLTNPAYPNRVQGEVVSDDWIRENVADLDEPWQPSKRSTDLERDETLWLLSDKKRSATMLRVQRILMRNPFVPLIFRLTVILFAATALALGTQIYQRSDSLNDSPALRKDTQGEDVDSQYICKQQPSTYLAFIVDSVAVVYLVYITYDEYFSKPLGLRSSKAKIRLLFLDLFFIIFSAANLSLAFQTLTDQQWSCYNGSAVNTENTEAARSVCIADATLCSRQRALCSVLTVAEVGWVTTFMISTLRINITHYPADDSVLDDSYIFITPYVSDFRVGSFGPQIFDNKGQLIWNGNDTVNVRAMDAHVCDFLGERGTHICYNDARPVEQAGHSAGAIRFFDNTYTQVGQDFGAQGDLRAPDIHELNTPPGQDGETFIQDVYEIRKADLTPYKGPRDGYVLDGCFQEVELRTKAVVFEWCAMDYVQPWHSYVYLYGGPNYTTPIAGNGYRVAPWDFFHINSVARNIEGDYAILARHMDAIYKIAGNNNPDYFPGTIIWQLGGKLNEFGKDFNFSRQHTVRFHSTGESESILSLFDNAWDGHMATSTYSSGKMISVNNATMQASLVAEYRPPNGVRSFSQGSLQLLDNGNVFIGWGNRNFYSEYTFDGRLLYNAYFSSKVESFRAWKFPWKGFPKTLPKVIAYAASCTAPMYVHASWNGATEIKRWRIYSSWTSRHGPWHHVGTFEKDGFETVANVSATALPGYGAHAPYVYADALDMDGNVLGSSAVVDTFVPRDENVAVAFRCTETRCEQEWFRFGKEWSCRTCSQSRAAALWVVALLVCAIELGRWAVEVWWHAARKHDYALEDGKYHDEF